MYMNNFKSHAFLSKSIVGLYLLLVTSLLQAQTPIANKSKEVALPGMSVMGNSEQPKVLYLVPWQPPSIANDSSDPPPKKMPGVMPMLDPTQHKKEVYFNKHLKVGVQSLKTH